MKTKTIFALCWIVFLASSCHSDMETTTTPVVDDNFTFYSSNDRYQMGLSERGQNTLPPFTIKRVDPVTDEEGNMILKATVVHERECNQFEFVWDGSVALSSPPNVYLLLRQTKGCEEGEQMETVLYLNVNNYIGSTELLQQAIFHIVNGSALSTADGNEVVTF